MGEVSLLPKFCKKCGTRLIISEEAQDGYSQDSGQPTYKAVVICPNNGFFFRHHYDMIGNLSAHDLNTLKKVLAE